MSNLLRTRRVTVLAHLACRDVCAGVGFSHRPGGNGRVWPSVPRRSSRLLLLARSGREEMSRRTDECCSSTVGQPDQGRHDRGQDDCATSISLDRVGILREALPDLKEPLKEIVSQDR
jgi:hypothetical protein